MKRVLPWLGVVAAGLVLVSSLAFTAIAVGAQRNASAALDGAQRLYDARVAVADAQELLGETNLKDGIRAGRRANAVALRVKAVTERIVRLLRPTQRATQSAVRSAAKGANGAAVANRQTRAATEVIGAVDGYQAAASRYATITNRALARVLRALRRTNDDFSPTRLRDLLP